MTDEAERLRATTERMANRCLVDMRLWQVHSTNCLEAASKIERLCAEVAAKDALITCLHMELANAKRVAFQAQEMAKEIAGIGGDGDVDVTP